MIETTDLTSYISGYDDYCEPKETYEKYDYSDEFHEEFMIRKELVEMERLIIDLKDTSMTFEDIMRLQDYVWQEDKLIPLEKLLDD